MPPPTIAVVAFDQISPFHLSVPCVVFGDTHADGLQFDLKVCSIEPGTIKTTAGFSLTTEHGLAVLEKADTIIVPSWRDPAEHAPTELLNAVANAQQRGAQVVGLCLGAYVLAQAGLLDGRRATTHWAYARDFAQRHPRVHVDANVLYVDDGNLLTSAGTAAGIDCCLHMIRRGYGAESANHVARRLVVPPHRQGGQAQFIDHPVAVTAGDSRLSELIGWLRGNLHHPHSLDSLAEKTAMSRRSFTRHFRRMTGTTVGQWLHDERLALAQRLLESSEQSVDSVATHAGFGSPESLRLHFRNAFGVSPTQWRRTFKG